MTTRALWRATSTLLLALTVGLGLVGISASPASAHDAVAVVYVNGLTAGSSRVYNSHQTISACDTRGDAHPVIAWYVTSDGVIRQLTDWTAHDGCPTTNAPAGLTIVRNQVCYGYPAAVGCGAWVNH
ncbi:hypothetical protein [Sphaerisporangium aureirubrum]|uniref:Ig-like domain-containing protein n=1 Tax=Sphaerisporangium aureirubrum TaxID=1544736 RepID=A0ABW1NJ75_9ACTN